MKNYYPPPNRQAMKAANKAYADFEKALTLLDKAAKQTIDQLRASVSDLQKIKFTTKINKQP